MMNIKVQANNRGITLLELMIVIAIIGIAATIAVPSVQNLLRNNQVASQNNELVSLVTFAKSQAIRNNENWQVELKLNGSSWSGYVLPAERDVEPEEDENCPEESGVVRCSDFQGLTLTANETTLEFNNRGFLVGSSSAWSIDGIQLRLRHPQCSGTRQAREIEILPTGQIISTESGCT